MLVRQYLYCIAKFKIVFTAAISVRITVHNYVIVPNYVTLYFSNPTSNA